MPWLRSPCRRAALALLCACIAVAGTGFSHKRHASLQLKCGLCHAAADTGERAGFPAARQCLLCHETMKDARLDPAGLSWSRPPRIPEYVIFSHATHRKARVECATCHGPVTEVDVPGPPAALHMKECIACHRQRKAATACDSCHDLRQ
jgi:hypothetical protein